MNKEDIEKVFGKQGELTEEEVKKKIQHQIDGRGTISYKVYKLND